MKPTSAARPALCRHTSLALALLPATMLVVGCGNESLSGTYVGTVDCAEAGSVGMEFSILEDKGSGIYDAEGEIKDLVVDGESVTIAMVGEVLQGEPSGPQSLELSLECGILAEDDVTMIDCTGFDELAFDGEDTLAAQISGFLGTDSECDISLTR